MVIEIETEIEIDLNDLLSWVQQLQVAIILRQTASIDGDMHPLFNTLNKINCLQYKLIKFPSLLFDYFQVNV